MQAYLVSVKRNTKLSKLIFKPRGRNLEIKMHKKWRNSEKVPYSWLFGDCVSKMEKVARNIQNKLKVREKLIEEPG